LVHLIILGIKIDGKDQCKKRIYGTKAERLFIKRPIWNQKIL
jgi:hypothetical protein